LQETHRASDLALNAQLVVTGSGRAGRSAHYLVGDCVRFAFINIVCWPDGERLRLHRGGIKLRFLFVVRQTLQRLRRQCVPQRIAFADVRRPAGLRIRRFGIAGLSAGWRPAGSRCVHK
jgi:hypothetical protein